MARRYYSSVAVPTTLFASVNSSVTTLTFNASTGFPSSYPFTLLVDEDTAYEEIVTVTAALGGNAFTVTRGVDGTTGQAHNSGAAVRHGFSARDLDEPNAHIQLSAAVHGLAGTVVGTTDTQTLTNKTLTTPTVTQPVLTLKQDTTATPTAEGAIEWDTDDNRIAVGDGATTKVFSDDSVTVVHGATGAVVGTTNTQTLTNKTLTTPTIGSFTNATHDHSGTAGGGTIAASVLTGVTGTVVGTSQSQTLTNKTIDGDDNTLTDIAASSVKKSAWTSYVATLNSGWTGGTPTIAGAYIRIGNTVHLRGSLVLSAGMTLTTTPVLSVPLAVISGKTFLGHAYLNDNGTTAYLGHCHAGGVEVEMWVNGTNGTRSHANSSTPFVWAAGDDITWQITYETDAA